MVLFRLLRWALGSAGIPIFVTASTLLCLIEQDNGQDKFGQPGGVYSKPETDLASDFRRLLPMSLSISHRCLYENGFSYDLGKINLTLQNNNAR